MEAHLYPNIPLFNSTIDSTSTQIYKLAANLKHTGKSLPLTINPHKLSMPDDLIIIHNQGEINDEIITYQSAIGNDFRIL